MAVDISEAALKLAKENSGTHQIGGRLSFMQGHWLSSVEGVFDYILSNPPYITTAAMEELSPEVRNFDPDLALRGGSDGLDAYKVIADQAASYLAPTGQLCVEIGYDQGKSVPELLINSGWEVLRLDQDLSGHDRMVIAAPAANSPNPAITE